MKKIVLGIACMALLALSSVFTACTKDSDSTPPVITLSGSSTIEVVLHSDYTEPGYTATDDKDGTITNRVVVTGSVDKDKIGTYTITYSVSDDAGNLTQVTRTVDVVVNSATYLGTYHVSDVVTGAGAGTFEYNVPVTVSSIDQTKLLFANFGGFGTPVVASINFAKDGTLTISAQDLTGTPGYEGHLTGTGITSLDGTTLTINYTYIYADGTGTATCVATYTKQK